MLQTGYKMEVNKEKWKFALVLIILSVSASSVMGAALRTAENLISDEDDYDEHADQEVLLLPGSRRLACCSLLSVASFVAALGGVLFGYDIGIISGALLQLRKDFNLSCSNQEWVVTTLIIGGLAASLIGGQIVDYFGRRTSIMINSLIFVGGALLLAFSQSYATLLIGRLLLGFAVSLSAIAECIYISEIAPSGKRGMLVSLNELGITCGILIAYLVNYLLIEVNHGWRIMFGLSSIPAILQGIGMFLLPLSPRWLISQKRNIEASNFIALLWPNVDAQEAIEKIEASLKEEKTYKLTDLASTKQNMRLRMIIGSGIVFFQQITGQPTILYYAPAVFFSFGFNSGTSATLATVGLGIVKVIFTMLTLFNVDKLGRRLFLLLGTITMTLSVIILSGVTQKVDHLHSNNPCDMNFIGRSHVKINITSNQAMHYGLSNIKDNLALSTVLTKNFSSSEANRLFHNMQNTRIKRENATSNPKMKHFLQDHHPSLKYICLAALMTFVAGYAIGFGPVSWLILTEIFPVGIKGRAVAMATSLNWGTNIILSMVFLDLIGSLGPSRMFLIFSTFGILSVLFIYKCVPETKRRSLEQISQELSKRSIHCGMSTCCQTSSTFSVPANVNSDHQTTTNNSSV